MVHFEYQRKLEDLLLQFSLQDRFLFLVDDPEGRGKENTHTHAGELCDYAFKWKMIEALRVRTTKELISKFVTTASCGVCHAG